LPNEHDTCHLGRSLIKQGKIIAKNGLVALGAVTSSGQASYQEKASHMPSLWQARAHQTKLPTLASSAEEKMAGT
jgi:hypothetical protein